MADLVNPENTDKDKPVTAKPLVDESEQDKTDKNPLKKKPSPPAAPINQNPDSVLLDVKLNDKPKDAKTPFNFKQGKFTSDFVKQKAEGELFTPTQPSSSSSSSSSSSPSTSSAKPKETVEEIRAQLLSEEAAEENKMSLNDYEDTADFIIDLVDMVVVFIIRAVSLDSTDAPYQPPKDKIDKLKKHLTRLLIRQNTKFNMGWLFLLAVLAAYGTPLKKSLEHRSMVMAERAKKKKSGEDKTEIKDNLSGNPLKKRPGRQPK